MKKIKRKSVIFLSVFVLLLLMVSPLSSAGQAEEKPDALRLGFAPATYDFTDFFGQLDIGIRSGLNELGIDFDVYMQTPPDISDHAAYASGVDGLVSLGVDYIVAVPSQLDLHIETFRRVNDAGIPLIFAQPDIVEGVEALQWAGASNFNAGEIAANYMIDLLGAGSQIVALHGQAGSFVNQGRVDHAIEILKEAGIEVLAEEYADFSRAKALDITEDLLSLYDDIDLIYAGSSAMAIGALTAVENAGRDIPVIGVGGDMEEIKMILEGRLQATIFRDPAEIGRGIAKTIYLHMTGQEDEIEYQKEFNHVVIDSEEDVFRFIPSMLLEDAGVTRD